MKYQSNIIDIVKVKNGESLYTWIAYANADGVDDQGQLIGKEEDIEFSLTDSSNKAYIGIASNKREETESLNYKDYKWSKIQGASGQLYYIQVNASEIKRYYEGGEKEVSFSPDLIYFYVCDSKNNEIDFDVSAALSVNVEIIERKLINDIYETTSHIITPGSELKYSTLPEVNEDTSVETPKRKYWQFKITSLSEVYDFLKEQEAFFSVNLFEEERGEIRLVASQILPFGWALSSDYAKFWITAQSIQASVDNAGLKFDSNGLTISNSDNGGIRILHKIEYVKSQDTEVIEGKKYYIESNGIYTEVTPPSGSPVDNNYYEFSPDSGKVVFNADTAGNLEVTGKINALEGKIGNIDIADGGLSYSKDGQLIFSLNDEGLVANSGSLGNLNLTGDLKLESGGSITASKSDGTIGFSLNGSDGSIIANNITLGDFVKISRYLQLGEHCWIFNPDAYDSLDAETNNKSNWVENSFINVNYLNEKKELKTAVAITKDGFIRLKADGNSSSITLDGQNGAIYSSNSLNESNSWRIDNDSAVFNNITARGALKCAVLEYGEIQSVGGLVLVRPSSTIKEITVNKDENPKTVSLTLVNAEQFKLGNYCRIQVSDELYYIVKISDINSNIIKIIPPDDFDINNLLGASIIDFGSRTMFIKSQDATVIIGKNYYKEINGVYTLVKKPSGSPEAENYYEYNNNEDVDSYGIGLNASDHSELLPERALSLISFTYNQNTKQIEGNSRIILGYIPNSDIYGSIKNQYGLYADNVLVRGKLISDTGTDGRTSGIDSFSNVSVPSSIKDLFTDNKAWGNIIFWAGAEKNSINGSSINDIQNAPFWVDSCGNLYAGRGYFDGAIVTKSRIEATEIKTALITGTGEDDYALKIKDSGFNAKAIKFYEVNGDTETCYFSLTKSGIFINGTTPINMGNKITIGTDGIIAPYFRISPTEKKEYTGIFNNSRVGFEDYKNENFDDFSGFTFIGNIGERSLDIVKDNKQYIKFSDDTRKDSNGNIKQIPDVISTLKRLSINGEFDLWDNIEFKKIIKDNKVIGFDIEIWD